MVNLVSGAVAKMGQVPPALAPPGVPPPAGARQERAAVERKPTGKEGACKAEARALLSVGLDITELSMLPLAEEWLADRIPKELVVCTHSVERERERRQAATYSTCTYRPYVP